MNVKCVIRTGALCISGLLASGQLVWGGQSPPEKDKEQTGSQAGSGGKAPDQLGSRGATESPMRTSDPSKTTKKKKGKKPAPTKSSSSSS
jgi:hypothetical protein